MQTHVSPSRICSHHLHHAFINTSPHRRHRIPHQRPLHQRSHTTEAMHRVCATAGHRSVTTAQGSERKGSETTTTTTTTTTLTTNERTTNERRTKNGRTNDERTTTPTQRRRPRGLAFGGSRPLLLLHHHHPPPSTSTAIHLVRPFVRSALLSSLPSLLFFTSSDMFSLARVCLHACLPACLVG